MNPQKSTRQMVLVLSPGKVRILHQKHNGNDSILDANHAVEVVCWKSAVNGSLLEWVNHYSNCLTLVDCLADVLI